MSRLQLHIERWIENVSFGELLAWYRITYDIADMFTPLKTVLLRPGIWARQFISKYVAEITQQPSHQWPLSKHYSCKLKQAMISLRNNPGQVWQFMAFHATWNLAAWCHVSSHETMRGSKQHIHRTFDTSIFYSAILSNLWLCSD